MGEARGGSASFSADVVLRGFYETFPLARRRRFHPGDGTFSGVPIEAAGETAPRAMIDNLTRA